MADLIDRQAAIDAIHCDITVTGRQNAELVAATIGTFADRIKALPSAQPEIIRCKDCKFCVDLNHDGDYSCLTPYGYRHIDRSDWYCADAERRRK